MQKKLITKFEIIALLVNKIKELHKSKQSYDWYFERLANIYSPLIHTYCKKLLSKNIQNVNYIEIKTRILEILLDAVLKYNRSYNENNNPTESFNHVYFSNYLKRKLPWDCWRINNPIKVEYDDNVIDSRHVELDFNNPEIQDKLQHYHILEKPISDNFISLCRLTKKSLCSDVCADAMMLQFGYGFRNSEIAKLFNCSPERVCLSLIEVKEFWKNNKDQILP
jgi:hypothetical protein